jgi:hypothetical protein
MTEQTEEDAYNEMWHDLTTERDRLIAALQMCTDQVLEAQTMVRQTIVMVHEARQSRDRWFTCAVILFACNVGQVVSVWWFR